LQLSLCGISLRNPIIAASGTFAYGVEFASVADLEAIGAFVVKGISRRQMDGNSPPRLWETEGGMMNSIGLQNIGVEAFVRDKVPALRQVPTPYFVNVFGYEPDDYLEIIHILDETDGHAGYELN